MSLLPIARHKQQVDGTPFRFVDEKYGIDCACGFTMTTPHGNEDAIAVAQDHVQRFHPGMASIGEAVEPFVKKR